MPDWETTRQNETIPERVYTFLPANVLLLRIFPIVSKDIEPIKSRKAQIRLKRGKLRYNVSWEIVSLSVILVKNIYFHKKTDGFVMK